MAKITQPSTHHNPRLRLLLYGGSRPDICSIGCSDSSHQKLHKLDNVVDDMKVVGSDNGLICFSSNNDLFIWNPCTNECHKLPQQEEEEIGKRHLNAFFSFFFDPSRDDYLVCKIAREWGCWITVESYSLNSNSWKNNGCYNLPFVLGDESDPVTINGVPHWLAIGYGSGRSIVAFDLKDESFYNIPFPQDLSTEDKEIKIGVFDGCLSLFIHGEDCLDSYDCEVWVMREYRNGDSWRKEFSVPYFTGMVQPFTSTGSGGGEDGLLVLKNLYGDLLLYDPVKDEEVECLYIGDGSDDEGDDDPEKLCNYNVASYIESKVSVKHDGVVNRKRKRGGGKQGKRVLRSRTESK